MTAITITLRTPRTTDIIDPEYPLVKGTDMTTKRNPENHETTHPGLTYVGTAYGCRVHVDPEYDGKPMGTSTAMRHAESRGVTFYGTDYWCEDGDCCGYVRSEMGAAATCAVSPAGLERLDTWVEWSERVLTKPLDHTPAFGETAEEAAEPYQPQFHWGREPKPDTRSTDLLTVESGRVVLHLESDERFTGLESPQDGSASQFCTARYHVPYEGE